MCNAIHNLRLPPEEFFISIPDYIYIYIYIVPGRNRCFQAERHLVAIDCRMCWLGVLFCIAVVIGRPLDFFFFFFLMTESSGLRLIGVISRPILTRRDVETPSSPPLPGIRYTVYGIAIDNSNNNSNVRGRRGGWVALDLFCKG